MSLTLILGALTAGAQVALQDATSSAIKDAYAGLKDLIRRKLGSGSAAGPLLDQLERNPDAYSPALRHELETTSVATDAEVLAATQKLRSLLSPGGITTTTVNVGEANHSAVAGRDATAVNH